MSGTSIVHKDARLTPTKLELLQRWLPDQPWFDGDAEQIERVASYRFSDPHGEVGMEGILFRSAGKLFHTALTYRGEPLEESKAGLIGTMEHSALGTRYVYDAPADPMFVAELIRVIREGDTGADIQDAGSDDSHATDIRVEGSGVPPVADVVGIVRLLTDAPENAPSHSRGILTGVFTVDGVEREVVLASLK